MSIIKGTTPIIRITFTTVDVSNITTAFLIIKQNGEVVIEKPLSEAVTGENSLEWKLSQTESLKLSLSAKASICCDWKLADGTRGRSKIIDEWIEPAGKNEVI